MAKDLLIILKIYKKKKNQKIVQLIQLADKVNVTRESQSV